MSNILKIVADKSATYKYEDIVEFFGFGNGVEISTEKLALLGIGANHSAVSDMVREYKDYYKMFLLPEEPNAFATSESYRHIINMENTFDLIFTCCKYTTEWRKNYYGIDKRVYTFTPFSTKFIYPDQEKIYPAYFTGHSRPSALLSEIYDVINKVGGKIVDASKYGVITHDEKMVENAKSKVSVTYGLLFLNGSHIYTINSMPHWEKCEAFSNIKTGLIPQMKTRVYEAALSKSIILHKKDEWNVIEDWYTPSVDFIYFHDKNDLEEKINEINKNYEQYKYIADNAYNKTINNYTDKHFIEKYILPNTKLEG